MHEVFGPLYEWEHWLHKYVPEKGRTFIDVGANVGRWSLSLADRFQKVIAIEPGAEACHSIRMKRRPNIRVINKAAWDCDGTLKLALYGDSTHTSPVMQEQGIGTGPMLGIVTVPCFSIDDLKVADCNLMKIDTEGSEVNVIKGAEKTIAASRPVLIIEIHNLPNRRWIETWLREANYKFKVVHHPDYKIWSRYYQMHLWIVANG